MTDFLSWSVELGQWRGVRVRVHISLILFIGLYLLGAALSEGHPVLRTGTFLLLFLVSLALHELGHAWAAYRVNAEPEDILFWPLGNLIPPPASFRAQESPWIAAGGLLTSGVIAITTAIVLAVLGVRMVFSPFGNLEDSGAPLFLATSQAARPFSPIWLAGWFGWINWVLFLINLIPALPLDNGRVLRSILAKTSLHPRDSLILPMTARACAVLLGVIGLFRLLNGRAGDFLSLVMLAVLIELIVRVEARVFEDGSEYETGAFGYDFSEGYTSLESSAAKVRPYRESALRRWRRRRSESRRQRRQAQALAEERRLDEILDEIHRLGKSSLSEEENRFLVRVSSRIRGKSKIRE